MNTNTVEWCDITLNPIPGCTDATYEDGTPREECAPCYARRIAARLAQNPLLPRYHGLAVFKEDGGSEWTGKMELVPSELEKLRALKTPKRIFIESMGDIAHENVTEVQYATLFEALLDAQPVGHLYYLLSKRVKHHAELLRAMRARFGSTAYWKVMRSTVLMTTAGTQRAANETISDLLSSPAVQFGVSVEPMKTPISLLGWMHRFPEAGRNTAAMGIIKKSPRLRPWYAARLRLEVLVSTRKYSQATSLPYWAVPDPAEDGGLEERCHMLRGRLTAAERPIADVAERFFEKASIWLRALGWVVTGGESGAQAAIPPHPRWFRDLRDECEMLGVDFFFKQWGTWMPIGGAYQEGVDQAVAAHVARRQQVACVELDGQIAGQTPTASAWHMVKVGKRAAGRVLDGRLHEALPPLPISRAA